jgi:hypothetical protein
MKIPSPLGVATQYFSVILIIAKKTLFHHRLLFGRCSHKKAEPGGSAHISKYYDGFSAQSRTEIRQRLLPTIPG